MWAMTLTILRKLREVVGVTIPQSCRACFLPDIFS
jgi:hypothetical protein